MPEPSSRTRLPSDRTDLARLIVCERSGRWATALGRELEDDAIRVYQTRNLPECWHMLEEYRAGFLIVEVTRSNLDQVLQRLSEMESRFPAARVAAVGDRNAAALESAVREAGAIQFITSTRLTRSITDAARNHLAWVPKRRLSLVERIWESLPWKNRRVPQAVPHQ